MEAANIAIFWRLLNGFRFLDEILTEGFFTIFF